MSCIHNNTHHRILSMPELNQSKKQSLVLSKHLYQLADETHDDRYRSQADRVSACSTIWVGMYCPQCGTYHYMHTTGCKHRLCPTCAAKAARVTAMQALEAIEYIQPSQASLLTLTVQNVEGEDLSRNIDSQLAAWQKLRKLRMFDRLVSGWARTIEIVPALHDRKYHPHVHAIILHDTPLGDMAYSGWWSLSWRDCMGLDYNPICDIRPIEDRQGAVFEVSKYISKLSRIYDNSEREHDNIRYIGNAIYNRQLRTYGGSWLKARRALRLLAVEQMDDDAISEYGEIADTTCEQCKSELVQVSLYWAGLTYRQDGIPMTGLQTNDIIGGTSDEIW